MEVVRCSPKVLIILGPLSKYKQEVKNHQIFEENK